MNDPDQPTAATFSTLAGSTSAQSAFFASVVQVLQNYGFDGVDIDWEYPVAPERSGAPADRENYVSFLTNLRSALGMFREIPDSPHSISLEGLKCRSRPD